MKDYIQIGIDKGHISDKMTLGTGTCHEAGIKQIKVKNMKIFHSYGHDSNEPLIEKIKDYLSKDADGNLKHEVWIDTSDVLAGRYSQRRMLS